MTFVITNNGTKHDLPMDDAEVSGWLHTYKDSANIILHQLNSERMFQPLFDTMDEFTAIDLGANIGLFSLYLKGKAKKIISVEPAPKTFNILKKLTANEPNIEILQGAASDTNGQTTFFISYEPTINSLVNKTGEEVTVNCYTIDSIMKKFNLDYVDFIKCDIEGGELLALTDETISVLADKVGF